MGGDPVDPGLCRAEGRVWDPLPCRDGDRFVSELGGCPAGMWR